MTPPTGYTESEGAIRFDISLCPKFRYPQDFDREKYDVWLRLSGITGRPSAEDVLVNIEAAERSGGKLIFRNAGVLFFAKNVRHFFNQAYITCLLAKGADKVHILDRKDFTGGIVSDIEDSLRFIERNTRTAYRIEKLQREDIPEYPMAALREAITNAVMHRDWFMEGANVFVEIYTDRIEISSPGGLPKGMKLSDLGRKSIRRNALIADLLHRITFIEKAGTGIKRMRDEAHDQRCPAPIFENNGFFTAIFYPNPEVRAQMGTREEPKTPQVTPQVGTKSGPSRDRDEAHETADATGHVPDMYPASTPQVPPKFCRYSWQRHQEKKREKTCRAWRNSRTGNTSVNNTLKRFFPQDSWNEPSLTNPAARNNDIAPLQPAVQYLRILKRSRSHDPHRLHGRSHLTNWR